MASRFYFGVTSLAILALCVVNYWVELTPSWKGYQRAYYARLAERIDEPEKAAETRRTPAKFVQIYNQELGVTDRCVICHLGMESPLMEAARNPFKAHPGKLFASHPFQTVGCTMCHQGQGLATTLEDAHGQVAHWDRPLLVGDFVQATCTKCHHEDEIPGAPVLSRGKRLLGEQGCVGCHRTGLPADGEEKVGPRLAPIGSKVSRWWLTRWLTNPKDYLPKGQMPVFALRPQAANALAAYLMTFHDKTIDARPKREGDADAGAAISRESQCVVCHVTKTDYAGKPVGGTVGPDLRKLGNKVNKRWLVAFLENPHAFYPNTKMPQYNFSGKEALDLAEFATGEWSDTGLEDLEKKAPAPPPDTPQTIAQGKRLYAELGCAGCHELTGGRAEPPGPDLTFIGSKPVHDLDFGDAKVQRTLPEFLYTKLKSPRALVSNFRLPLGEDAAVALWKNLQPPALFSASEELPGGSPSDRLAWILAKAQEQGALDRTLALPEGPAPEQAAWLAGVLNEAGLLNALKMPDFQLADADAEALSIALMSLSAERVPSARFEVPRQRKVIFNPQDDFGELSRRYRCRSCHTIRGSGDLLASDITLEGSKVNREWLYEFLKKPYSMRRTITIAMPIFHFPDEEARFMAEYMSRGFADTSIGVGWKRNHAKADAARGKGLFDAKGCIACHQVQGKGGDVGPALTTQVPEFPRGTWVGDKLKGEWIYQWLKDPQSLVPDTLEPNLALSDQEALDVTAYLLSLKNPAPIPKSDKPAKTPGEK